MVHRSWMKNQGLPPHLLDGRPVIGICNTWSELTPCNAHFREIAVRVKRGVLEAGGYPLEFSVMSLGKPVMRSTAMLFRNLAATFWRTWRNGASCKWKISIAPAGCRWCCASSATLACCTRMRFCGSRTSREDRSPRVPGDTGDSGDTGFAITGFAITGFAIPTGFRRIPAFGHNRSSTIKGKRGKRKDKPRNGALRRHVSFSGCAGFLAVGAQ